LHALLLAFFSGGPALVYQVVWTREVSLLAGTQIDAVATVVAAFFGGLALGARVLGARVDASPRPLRFYASLELAAAALAIVSMVALRALHTSGPANSGAMLAACALALFPVTFLLGGTQPALLRSTGILEGDAAAPAGGIQGVNTAGAVLGVVFAAFAVPHFGLWNTLLVGVGSAASVGILALGLDRISAAPGVSRAEEDATRPQSPLPIGVLALAATAGAATLGFEVLAARMAALWLGSSLYAWALVLSLFLAGLAAGNLSFANVAARTARPAVLLAGIEAACAVALALGITALHPPLAHPSSGIRPGSLFAVAIGTLPAAFLMGAAFPLFARLVLDRTPGRSFGALSAWNTAGGIVGSLLAPILLLPALGMLGGTLACSALNFAVAAALFLSTGREWKVGLRSQAVATAAVYLASAGFGTYFVKSNLPVDVIHIEHGRHASAVVINVDGERELIVDGDSEAFTGGDARRTEELLAALPLGLHPSPKRFLEVGFGAGITLGAAARFPLDQIECVEISDAVLASARYLEPANRGVLRRDGLVIHHLDARAFLRTTSARYDVVVANTLHPWSLGATGLYSREYFEQFSEVLEPGGIAVQWIPAERIAVESFRSILRTFFDAFEHGYVFWGASNVILVGAHNAIDVPNDAMLAARLERGDFELAELRLEGPVGDSLRERTIARATDVRTVFGPEEILTDDRPELEADAVRGVQANDAEIFDALVALANLRRTDGRGAGHPALALWLEARAARAAGNLGRARSREALARDAGLGLAALDYAQRTAQEGRWALERGDLEEAEKRFLEVQGIDPQSRAAAFGQAVVARERGDARSGADLIRSWLETQPADAGGWNQLASWLAEWNDITGAQGAVDRAREANPYFGSAIANAGLLAAARGDVATAAEALEELRKYGTATQVLALEAALDQATPRAKTP